MNVVKNQRESGFEKIHNLCIAHSLFNPHTGKRKNPPFLIPMIFGFSIMGVRGKKNGQKGSEARLRVYFLQKLISGTDPDFLEKR